MYESHRFYHQNVISDKNRQIVCKGEEAVDEKLKAKIIILGKEVEVEFPIQVNRLCIDADESILKETEKINVTFLHPTNG